MSESFKDEHAKHLDAVLREPDPTKELAAREHIEGCKVCQQRLRRGVRMLIAAGLLPRSALRDLEENDAQQ